MRILSCTITENFLFGSGDLGGGIYSEGSRPTISGSVISYNVGGGIYFNDTNTTILTSEISNNSYGSNISAGIYCVNSNPSISKCKIVDNDIPGIRLSNSEARIDNCNISGNFESGIYAIDNSSFTAINTNITSNSGFIGGGISCLYNSSPTLTNCLIRDNQAKLLGGGIFLYNSSNMKLSDSLITNNNAPRGSALYCENSSPIVRFCNFVGNNSLTPNSAGGAIYTRGESDFTLENSTFFANVSQFGGGIHCFMNHNMTISNCLFSNNSASAFGGALQCVESTTVMTNCTVADNKAGTSEGGVAINNGHVTIMNCILWNNEGGSIGGNVPGDVIYNCLEIGSPIIGEGNIYDNPLFVQGPKGKYYLSNQRAGYLQTSPCVDAGNQNIIAYDLVPQTKTTRSDGIFDTDRIDMGFHYPPNIQFHLSIDPAKDTYKQGDTLNVLESVSGSFQSFQADIYFVLQTPENEWIYYHSKNWDLLPNPVLSNVTVPGGILDIANVKILTIQIPSERPPISVPGKYKFITFAKKSGTDDNISLLAEAPFVVEGLQPGK